MARCHICETETKLYDRNGMPICLECVKERERNASRSSAVRATSRPRAAVNAKNGGGHPGAVS